MPNKRTYVTILRRISDVDDTVLHYYSDDGLNWSEWYHVHYPAGDEIWQTEVLIGRGTNPWIYTFMRSKVQGSAGSGALILRRGKADASTWDWIYIAQPGDSIRRFAVDMDENEVLYLAYERILPSGDIRIYAVMSIMPTPQMGGSWTYSVWPPMNYNYGDIQYPWVETSIDYPVDICAALGTF